MHVLLQSLAECLAQVLIQRLGSLHRLDGERRTRRLGHGLLLLLGLLLSLLRLLSEIVQTLGHARSDGVGLVFCSVRRWCRRCRRALVLRRLSALLLSH